MAIVYICIIYNICSTNTEKYIIVRINAYILYIILVIGFVMIPCLILKFWTKFCNIMDFDIKTVVAPPFSKHADISLFLSEFTYFQNIAGFQTSEN